MIGSNALRSARQRPAVVIPALVALAVELYQLTLPHILLGVHGFSGLGYDDGVYFGAAVRLAHGAMPYKDFVLVHPPGVPLVLLPVALLSRLFGTQAGLALARVLTDLVVVGNVILAGKAVRHRGVAATWVASILMACWPVVVSADHSLILEPYLVFFCLLGVVTMFPNGELAVPRRIMWAGVFLGLATTMKIWGVLVVVVALLVCLPRWVSALRPLMIGLAVGFGIPCLPFFLAAPHDFVHQIIGDQLGRTTLGAYSLPVDGRLVQLSGLTGMTVLHAGAGLALLLAVLFVLVVGVGYGLAGATVSRFDWLILGAATTTTLAMFRSRDMYDHYAYFPVAFYTLLAGASVARILTHAATGPRARWLAAPAVPVAFAVLVAGLAVPEQVHFAKTYLSGAFDPKSVIDSVVPKGSCVVSDQVSDALVANRFVADHSCPDVVDSYGDWLASYEQNLPPYNGPLPASFVDKWRSWLTAADYVVEIGPQSDTIPWPPDELAWFNSNFTSAYSQTGLVVYRNNNRGTAGGATAQTPQQKADALVSEGLAAEHSGDLTSALADYRAAATADPTNVNAQFDIGEVEQAQGNSPEARVAYLAALKLNPRFGSALYNLGVLLTPDDPPAAIRYFRRDLAVDPHNAAANFNLGVLLYKSGQHSEGERYIGVGLQLEPSLAGSLPSDIPSPS